MGRDMLYRPTQARAAQRITTGLLCASLLGGCASPPLVGVNLFFASSRFGKPILEVGRAVVPLFPVLAFGVLVITYVPWLSTALTGLMR